MYEKNIKILKSIVFSYLRIASSLKTRVQYSVYSIYIFNINKITSFMGDVFL